MRRGGAARRTATALAGLLVVAACSSTGERSTSTSASRPPATTAPPRIPSAAAPRDVPDDTYPGLGDPRIDVASYWVRLAVTPPRSTAVAGTARITARAVTRRPLASFTLDLIDQLSADAVRVDGRRARVARDGDQIVITPARRLRPGRPFTTTVRYHGTATAEAIEALDGVAVGWRESTGGGSVTMSEPSGTRTWMPVSDHPSDKATFHVEVEVPTGQQVVGNGRLVAEQALPGGRTRWVWDHDQPMAPYLALVAVGRFDLVRRTDAAGRRVVEAYPAGKGAEGTVAFAELDAILTYFSERFGAYPYRDTGVVVVPDDLGVALENQTRPLFSGDTLDQRPAEDLAHELAHQWFGDDVSVRRWRDIWLNEGFATWADWAWRDHQGEATLAALADAAADGIGSRPGRVLDPGPVEEFGLAVYYRGALTLEALRRTVGDATFDRIVRTWVRERGGGNGTTEQFVALASKLAGKDLVPFFDAWLRNEAMPALPPA